jgi:hypothetical protein
MGGRHLSADTVSASAARASSAATAQIPRAEASPAAAMIDLAAIVFCPFCGSEITREKGHYWRCPNLTDEFLQRALKPSPLLPKLPPKRRHARF